MKKRNFNKVVSTFLALILLLQPFFTGVGSNVSAESEEGPTNPWTTISNGGNEVNEIVEKDGKTFAKLGTGVGNDNGAAIAVFREADAVGKESGTMEYTFSPETAEDKTRFGFFTHYKDHNNFVFVGYDKGGWFYEYKVDGVGNYLQNRPTVANPELGNEYTLVVNYDGTELAASLDGEELFKTELDDAVLALVEEPEALRLGHWNAENSQVLIDLGINSDTETETPEPGETEEPDETETPEIPEVTLPPVDTDWPEGPFEIVNKDFKEGDFEIIQGTGKLKYNDNGSVTLDADGASNKMVYTKMPEFFEGSFEADVSADKNVTRFGFIYRILDTGNYNYVGIGDQSDLYFNEIYGPRNAWSAMAKGPSFKAGETYRYKVDFAGDRATLSIDGEEIGSWELTGGVSEPGLIGFDKSRGQAAITISNLKISGTVPTPRPVEDTISSDYMDVTIDSYFPRVIDYNVGDKVLVGQETAVEQININGQLYTPKVRYDRVSDSKVTYKLSVSGDPDESGKKEKDTDKEESKVENVTADLTVSIEVKDNQVVYSIDDITNKGKAKIETIKLDGMNFVSVNSKEKDAEARLTRLSNNVNVPGDTDVVVDETLTGIGTNAAYYLGVISNDELSATIWSSSEVNGSGNVVANRYETEDGAKALGLSSNTFFYHHKEMNSPTSTPTVKVAIAEDLNGDNVTDWQDGAIAYRDIMQDIVGWELVNNQVGTRIAMNFGSQAQHPFLKTLDNVKKVSLATDDLGQSVLLKGYGNEGHDSAHPDYGDVGERMGGEIDLGRLIKEGAKYNTEFGVHINAQETYPEADAFSDDLILGPDEQGWGWIDQGYVIDKMYDLTSGLRAKRLDELKEAAPGLGFIYLDVWYQDQWESNRISEQFHERGWRLTTEFSNVLHNFSTWEHWATDKNYGGKTLKGKNSELLRFISNHQRDSWMLNAPEWGGTSDNPLLGGFELAGFEGWQSDKNFDNFIDMTFNTNVPTKFLQKYYVTNWTTVDGDPEETNLEQEIKLQDPSNDNKVVVTRKDDGSRERIVKLNDTVVLTGTDYLIPWVEQDFKNETPKAEKMYHWSLDGGETTWTLTDDFADASSVYVYELTDQGRTDKKEVKVVDGQVTLTAEAATPYIVVPKEDGGQKVTDWSFGAHVYDTGFNSGTIEDEYTTIEGDKDAVSVIRTDRGESAARQISSGDYILNIIDPDKDTTVSRTITDLEAGKDYVAEVYVENQSDNKAFIEVIGGAKDVSNYTLQSLQKNYVKADSHASNDGENSKMQRMQVSFTATGKTATLVIGTEAGEGIAKFDDIRVVQKSLTNDVNPRVFEQDFETVVQGIYPFVIGNTEGVEDNRIHLSEKNAPYTQKGWGGRVVDDVLGGDWSLKVNTVSPGLLYRTIPQHLRFEAGIDYKVSFDYQTSANNSFRIISGDQENDARNIGAVQGLSVNDLLPASTSTKKYEFTVTGSENGQTYIGIFGDGNASLNMGTGAGTFMLDNLRVEKIAPGMDVKEMTVYADSNFDLRSLVPFAQNSKGEDVTDQLIIDEGDYDPLTPGVYTITFTLKEEGFEDVVKTVDVTVELKPANWFSGAGAPQEIVGEKGDFYLDVTTGDLYGKGAEGWEKLGNIDGEESAGAEWLYGNGKPAADAGKVGDLYLDFDTGDVYVKHAETKAWELAGNIQGPAGEDGKDGATWIVDEGKPGKDVGNKDDLYLDTKTGDVYVKSDKGWEWVATLQGPAGEDGKPGQGGKPGEDGKPGQGGKPGEDGKPGQGGKPGEDGKPGQGGKPGEDGKPGQGGKPGGDVKPGKDAQYDQNGESDTGKQLPSTATAIFNWLVLGLVLTGMGVLVLLRRRRA